MEAAAVGEDQGDAALHAQSEPELTPMTPVRRGRGRPRKTAVQPPEVSFFSCGQSVFVTSFKNYFNMLLLAYFPAVFLNPAQR